MLQERKDRYAAWEIGLASEGNVDEFDYAIRSLVTSPRTNYLYQSCGIEKPDSEEHKFMQEEMYGLPFWKRLQERNHASVLEKSVYDDWLI